MAPNPMMAMAQTAMMANVMSKMQAGQAGQAEQAGGASSSGKSSKQQEEKEDGIDEDIQKLGDHFNVEERWIVRLNELMKKRRDTKDQDLSKLYEVLENARSPTGLLVAKIGEMECGQFVGKVKPDKYTERLARNFGLDKRVVSRLVELRVRRSKTKETKEEDFKRLEQHLKHSKRPSATATLLIGKLLDGEIRQIPDMTGADALSKKFRLDTDAKSKLREIVEKRAADLDEVLEHLDKTLSMSQTPSAMLCKIAATLIDGGRSSRSDKGRYENDARGSSCGSSSSSRSRRRRAKKAAASDSSRSRSRS
eukprot:CAMPEP_0195165908 /NCGR_PEP_ID=MMETSP0448-20130528/189397_1 /TAXON_ID=66468 /ORGANISM="Heterocapsa triquestra, Strain CCMP 448" /LENGTH=308 /DNA_ID=CAMNT_0040204701 /DNA_START=22 /DNA_END=945 /DNA_ORIENTATION=+